jgi:hypothetical protein
MGGALDKSRRAEIPVTVMPPAERQTERKDI